ncbi:MAG: sigma-70 family RNA polymerase sigma factor [Lentisphaerae bacterium]|nr:sigma-70 family RNA polymerase sigma factor [Lentisphaerota bacterium]
MNNSSSDCRNTLDDNALVEQVKNGNHLAFETIVSRYYQRLYQTALAILNSHHDAEEVTQDAFIKAYRALPGFRGDSMLLTWLCRIVINQAHNKYHWNRRRGSEVNLSLSRPPEPGGDQQQEDFNIPDMRHTPQRELQNAELGKLLNQEIGKLPISLRETMQLRHLQNLPYEEIAQKQHCQLGTIKSRLSRGRDLLLKRLEDYGITTAEEND